MKLKLLGAVAVALSLGIVPFVLQARTESDLAALRAQEARTQAAALASADAARREAQARADELESEIARLRDSQRQTDELLSATSQTATLKIGAARQEIEARTQTVEERLASLESKYQDNSRMADVVRRELEGFRQTKEVDLDHLFRWVMNPSAQVSAKDAVGGGVVLHCAPGAGRKFDVHILTAYHVIQKSIPKPGETTDPIEVKLYKPDASLDGTYVADIVGFTEKRDIALLRVTTDHEFKTLAKLASRDALGRIGVFTPIYAIGCPLGHDPMPTMGDVSTVHKLVNGERFWMVNAPTIFGNSGGGVYLRSTHELVGLSAMICTYDNFVSTPVPHLSIMVPLDAVYNWLDEQFLQYLYDPKVSKETCAKMREEAERKQPKNGS